MKRPATVVIDLTDRAQFPFMKGIALAMPGVIVEDEASGCRVRVLEDGHLELLHAGGRPGGVAAHSTATRRT